MVKFDAFTPRVHLWVPAAPAPLVETAICDCIIQLCEDSHVLQVVPDPQTLYPEQAEYDIDPVYPGMTLARVLKVWFGPDEQRPQGQPRWWEEVDPKTLRIYPTPQQDAKDRPPLMMRLALKPERTATQFPDEFARDWMDAVVGGAVMRLASMPDQPYSSNENAQKGAAMYTLWMGKARFEGTKLRMRRDHKVAQRKWE
jgi:hypothetical protein